MEIEQVSVSGGQAPLVLTPRQEEIRRMLRQGMRNKAIAFALGISEGTVKNHITEIFRALNATNRTEAAHQDRTIMFDIEEYLHLALHASSVGNHHACMTYLKEVLQQQPMNAVAIYLLAAQHAELGLRERAINGMRASLAIMPGLETARFQLGLLLLDAKRPAEAKEQLAALSGSRDPALRAYCEALIALADNNLILAREKLASGLSHPSPNAPLSALMRRVLGSLPESQPAAVGKPEAPDNPLNLGAYRNQFP